MKNLKIELETPVCLLTSASLNDEIKSEYFHITQTLICNYSLSSAHSDLEIAFKHFIIGRGGSHIWVKQILKGNILTDRILIATEQ